LVISNENNFAKSPISGGDKAIANPAFGGGGGRTDECGGQDFILPTESNILNTPGNDFDNNYGVRGNWIEGWASTGYLSRCAIPNFMTIRSALLFHVGGETRRRKRPLFQIWALLGYYAS
jgi:hypothetical protein